MGQFTSPIILILLFAAGLSLYLHDVLDSVIILVIVFISGLLGFWQEYRASNAVARLLERVRATATIVRDGRPIEVPPGDIVPGDVVLLSAGAAVPADGRILESRDLFVDESALTGESYPAEKAAGLVAADAALAGRTNALFVGSHVISGTARALVVRTGQETEYGDIAARLRQRAPPTEFERGLTRFGALLLRVTMLLVLAIFAANVYLHRPVVDSLLFALALAVGLTPELLPAIVSVTLARGAQRMARDGVIVRRLNAIENFGSMDVLCSDKTGTLTEGVVVLHGAVDVAGQPSEEVLRLAVLNATFQSGFRNPIDEALRGQAVDGLDRYAKVDEVPYDFIRKRLSIVVENRGDTGDRHTMITKGALRQVLAVCRDVEGPAGRQPLAAVEAGVLSRFEAWSRDGIRVLGVATRDVTGDPLITAEDEQDMTFAGFVLLEDPPKAGAVDALRELRRLGVRLKIITGDNRLIAGRLGRQFELEATEVLTGPELQHLSETALARRVTEVDVFAETEPHQKVRILSALRRAGGVVGFLGDGINDATALHTADVGISVEGAVDVAREAADIVLLERDLGVLARGVRNGRVTFANTLKYVFITTSANFGNMVSMAGISVVLPFLPLLPKQILLNNFLSDLPSLTIAADSVDPEMMDRPRRWDVRLIRNFMITFGLVSSVFDFVTFGALLLLLRASEIQFQTGWFIESLMTELFIVLVIRTRRRFYRSKPASLLTWATLLVAGTTILLPYSPFRGLFGFTPLPPLFLATLLGITAAYLVASEVTKGIFYRRMAA